MNPASREVHCWRVSLDVPSETAARLSATLSPDERSRCARLRYERDRRRFIVAHGALRDVLGRYLGTPPDDVRFAHNPFGKPELSPEFGSELRFNLSHSADLALIAIAAGADIGIDVELIRAGPDFPDVARHSFSAAEADLLRSLPHDLQADVFLRIWTKKEAYVKACGRGLTMPLTNGAAGPWSLVTLRPAPGYVGALAVEGRGWRLRQSEWRMPVAVGAHGARA